MDSLQKTSNLSPLIGIIIVHPTNGYEHTALCLETLRLSTYKNILIVVVDNGSSDGSGGRLREEFPETTYIRNETNDGFAVGNNIGIEYALRHQCKHVLLLNNDTIVTSSFLEPLVERIESDAMIGAVSGKIYYYPQAIGGKQKIIWYAGSYQKWHMAYNHTGELEEDKGQFDTPHEVAYASGCLMLMRGEVIARIGGLSEEYFMYWEESDWCMRARELRYSSWYEPRALICHNVRSSVKGKETPLYVYMMYRNFPIFAKRHFYGFKKIQFWLFFPLHIINRWRICIMAGNTRAAKAIFQGIIDYFKGYRGKQGLNERGLLR